ncbi:ketopantoate reductase family protein [Pedobacter chitinilyticus]|uniref:2-dehydropantoate 2-reductase n=1 Tax=Pedobacter chitinilyticus TaxID=2233776 RepID=A0A443YV99_9SPHI|nr:2-dehydropantoate 2-reductase [Pedobacter chitinilyticus]RWU07755.1 2-dehydropantoate 2-reductase [Pedobacter chitinilyticus]
MKKILVVGIGGVGGYFGGRLAKSYQHSDELAIYFLARGENLSAIQANGLTVVEGNERFNTKPHLATDDPTWIGPVDYVVLCIKNYDLDECLLQLKPCIAEHTVILPLLNGVDHREKIQAAYPQNLALAGCVYLVARLAAPGLVENTGKVSSLFFGHKDLKDDQLLWLAETLQQAGIEATLTQEITQVIWRKFVFVSAIATATSFYHQSVGQIVEDQEMDRSLRQLIHEVCSLAKASNVGLPDDIESLTYQNLCKLPYATTSSMQVDRAKHAAKTELESLTGYVVHQMQQLKLPSPTFKLMYDRLKQS